VPDLAVLREHTDAIVDSLDAGTTMKVFDAGAPNLNENPSGTGWGWQGDPGASKFMPYCIVYPLAGGVFDGPLGCPDDDASLTWQVTCVGATRAQCEWAADKANEILIGQPLTVAGRFISRVWADMAGGGARRDDTVQPPVFIATPRYRVESTPMPSGS
jgi:hypothetical protein